MSKILVVDDEKEIRDVLNILLTAEGYEVVLAEDDAQAIALAEQDEAKGNLVLEDLQVDIKNIRKKLGDDPKMPRYIKTAWGKGYYIE